MSITHKQNHDPLTEADLLANTLLQQHLLKNFPNDGWLSEETVDNPTRLSCQRVWIVDPMDGTKEFINNIPEYAISVALVEQGIPTLAAVYNPATQELFHASKNQGTWLNGKPIHCSQENKFKNIVILVSRTEYAEGKWDTFKNQPMTIKTTGSIAYKLALVAKGAAHATISLVAKNEWDIAAGVLLVQEAGGKVTDLNGNEYIFNQKNTLVPGIIASSKQTYPALSAMFVIRTSFV